MTARWREHELKCWPCAFEALRSGRKRFEYREDCCVMQSQAPEWDSDTYWPKEAVAVLEARL